MSNTDSIVRIGNSFVMLAFDAAWRVRLLWPHSFLVPGFVEPLGLTIPLVFPWRLDFHHLVLLELQSASARPTTPASRTLVVAIWLDEAALGLWTQSNVLLWTQSNGWKVLRLVLLDTPVVAGSVDPFVPCRCARFFFVQPGAAVEPVAVSQLVRLCFWARPVSGRAHETTAIVINHFKGEIWWHCTNKNGSWNTICDEFLSIYMGNHPQWWYTLQRFWFLSKRQSFADAWGVPRVWDIKKLNVYLLHWKLLCKFARRPVWNRQVEMTEPRIHHPRKESILAW